MRGSKPSREQEEAQQRGKAVRLAPVLTVPLPNQNADTAWLPAWLTPCRGLLSAMGVRPR